jgi:hypothetical protein
MFRERGILSMENWMRWSVVWGRKLPRILIILIIVIVIVLILTIIILILIIVTIIV